ncbi:MAG TPA: TadE/TadG family type IV pilus assembly protein [Gaiellaceae bacterium]|nr:TadE/TadG family type IV pilus assembly protein [Gaiellaceae bacterium]
MSRLRDEGGQAIVEFALVLPILLMVVTGIVQFGIAFNHYLTLTDAVRAGARVAAVSSDAASPTPACNAVEAAAPTLGLVCGSTIQVTPSPDWSSGSTVTVSASSNYTISVFGLNVVTVPLSSSMSERIE